MANMTEVLMIIELKPFILQNSLLQVLIKAWRVMASVMFWLELQEMLVLQLE